MNKLDLIAALSKESKMSKAEASQVVQLFFDSMAESLVNNDRIEIRGLWSFTLRKYKGYTGRNPRTGEMVRVKPKKLPFFKCGRELMGRVNKRS